TTPHEETAMPFEGIAERAIDRAILAPTPPLLALDALRAKGWAIDARTAAMLGALDAAGGQVEGVQLAAGSVGPTRTIRVIGAAGRPFPSTLLPVLAPSPKILAFVLDDVRVQLAGTSAIVPRFDALTWQGGAASDYDTLLSYALMDAGAGIVVPFA